MNAKEFPQEQIKEWEKDFAMSPADTQEELTQEQIEIEHFHRKEWTKDWMKNTAIPLIDQFNNKLFNCKALTHHQIISVWPINSDKPLCENYIYYYTRREEYEKLIVNAYLNGELMALEARYDGEIVPNTEVALCSLQNDLSKSRHYTERLQILINQTEFIKWINCKQIKIGDDCLLNKWLQGDYNPKQKKRNKKEKRCDLLKEYYAHLCGPDPEDTMLKEVAKHLANTTNENIYIDLIEFCKNDNDKKNLINFNRSEVIDQIGTAGRIFFGDNWTNNPGRKKNYTSHK